jgi:hypothetical protein|tara:strand:+ start:333 stop:527 length:195 start_codon:yes stop_codon:yes gene_type:complete
MAVGAAFGHFCWLGSRSRLLACSASYSAVPSSALGFLDQIDFWGMRLLAQWFFPFDKHIYHMIF